jgi:hypothetical protein
MVKQQRSPPFFLSFPGPFGGPPQPPSSPLSPPRSAQRHLPLVGPREAAQRARLPRPPAQLRAPAQPTRPAPRPSQRALRARDCARADARRRRRHLRALARPPACCPRVQAAAPAQRASFPSPCSLASLACAHSPAAAATMPCAAVPRLAHARMHCTSRVASRSAAPFYRACRAHGRLPNVAAAVGPTCDIYLSLSCLLSLLPHNARSSAPHFLGFAQNRPQAAVAAPETTTSTTLLRLLYGSPDEFSRSSHPCPCAPGQPRRRCVVR